MAQKYVVYKGNAGSKSINVAQDKSSFDWIIDNSVRIQGSAFANAGGNTTLYTVPKGKTLYISNLTLTADNDLGAVSDSIVLRVSGNILTEMYVGRVATEFSSMTFNLPLKVNSNETIVVYAGASAKAICSLVGYEINSVEQPNIKFTK